ncbi:MAG TPA: EamA family transporter RarD [Nevskia sp.]|nr:EamA family transporter RarD [Nevskia sp.]
MNRSFYQGFWAVFGAFVIWGLFPLYWHQLREVPALQIVAHRVVWCGAFVGGWLLLRNGTGWLLQALRQPRAPLMLACSSILISLNWGLYIWAVNNGHVVESSLGYFINPLVNVLLGVVVLHEKLNTAQRLAVACAAAGVAWLTWQLGALPWIALALALSFGSYGLIRKIAAVEAIPGLGVESVFLFLPALAYLLWTHQAGAGAFGHLPAAQNLMLVAGGAMTAIPLIWFAYGARRIPYSLVGIIQYVGPTLQLLTGVFLFGESFTPTQAVGFGLIWAALAIYAADGLWRSRSRAPAPMAPAAAAETK